MLRNNYVLRTSNGGVTFDSTYTLYSYLYDVYFKDALTGVLCGDGALIMKSTDGGVTWNQVVIPLATELPPFRKETFVGNAGWVVGGSNNPQIGARTWRTTDFGSTWDTLGWVRYPNGTEPYCVFFSSLSTGWCGGSYGYVFKTTDGGFNWIQENSPSTNNFFIRSFYFHSDSVGWGVGGGGHIINTTTGGMPVWVVENRKAISSEFKLFQNYPNPFNQLTIINFQLSIKANIKIAVYDLLGRETAVLVNEEKNAGTHEIEVNGEGFPSGLYFYSLFSEGKLIDTKKLVLIK